MIVTRTLRLFITYIKENSNSGELYIGRASGQVNGIDEEAADKIRKRRNNNHHRNKDNFGKAVIDRISTDYNAIRGREDMMIRRTKELGISGNKYNGISIRNKKRQVYLNAAINLFGDIVLGLIMYNWVFQ